MFYSKYLPVNIKRKNAAVHTQGGCYPAELVNAAYDALSTGTGLNSEVLVEDGIVSFVRFPEYRWTIPDIYLAHEALCTAMDNNFSFYVVNNKEDIPQLFVSKAFKQHRLLVNALSFRTVIVTKPNLVKRISAMIDGKFDTLYCMNTFDVIEQIENGSPKYLDAIICDRDTEDECMVVNPITTMYSDDNIYYSKDVIEEYRALLENPDAETELVALEGDVLKRKNVKGFAPVSLPFAKSIVALYDKLLEKKCNYLYINGDDLEVHYYVSTNWRYFVNAQTLECVVVKNANVKKLLQSYVAAGQTNVAQLQMCWMIAVEEPS